MALKKNQKKIKWKNPLTDKDIYVNWDGEFDPGEYLETMIETKLDQRILTEIDEREMPRAANFVEFCYGKNFLNFKPLPRAIQVISTMLGEMCPFCSDKELSNNMYNQSIDEIYEKVVFTRYGRCPKCSKTRIDFLRHKKWWMPDRLVAVIGQRAGKNIMFAQAKLYLLHRFLTLELSGRRVTPYEYFGLAPGPLRMTFTAVTLGQAMDTIWGPFSGMFEEAPWFQEYGKFLNFHGKKKGVELYAYNTTFINYKNKRVDIACRAPDQRKLRGSTRFSYGIDEVCWFDAKAEEKSKGSDKVLGSVADIDTSLSNSLKTVRNAALKKFKAGDFDVPTGYSFHISSPCHANDIGMIALRESRSNIFISAWNFPTWEFNPEFTSQDDFRADYLKDPVKAERDFGALPPLTVSPWITDPRPVLLASRTQADPMLLNYSKRTETNPFGETTTWFKLDNIKDAATPRIIAIDNGLSNNAFALVILSIRKGVPRVDECYMLKPDESQGIKVNLDKMFEDFVYPLATKMNVVCGVYDQWNSDQNIQKLRSEGRDWRKYSLKPTDFDFIRGKLQASEVSLPFAEFDLNVFLKSDSAELDLVRLSLLKPNFALILQTLSVRQLGVRLRKPLYGDDDVFRAAALGVKHLYDEDLRKQLDHNFSQLAQQQTNFGVVSYRSFSSGAGSQSSASAPSKSVAVARTKSRG
jgi:hypothetical protein